MKVEVHTHSSYPRFAKGDVGAIIAQQEAAGCDVVTDGLAPWADPFAVVIDAVDGLLAGEPLPYFNGAISVRRPRIVGRLQHRNPLTVEAFLKAQRLSKKPVKAVLPGAYTLASCAVLEVGAYAGRQALAEALAQILAVEVEALVEAGATLIQIEEPAILTQPQDIRMLREILEPIWSARRDAALIVSTWGSPSAPLYAQLNSLPADVIGVDLGDPDLAPLVESTGASKVLALGIPGTNVHAADVTVDRLLRMLRRYELDQVILTTPSGLRMHTAARAFDALQQLVTVGSLLRQAL